MQDRGTPLVVYNSLTRRSEEFRPMVDDQVRIYSCGPTVYNYPHIGNLRAYVLSDTLQRALRWKGYEIRKVVNITDVGHLVADADSGDDKLEEAARASTESVYDLARRYEAAFHADLEMLRILPADLYPRATDYIPQMVEFAAVLERKGAAYRLPTGLYFDTSTSPGYGRLAGLRADDQREGARVDVVAGKRNKTDFAVWRTEQPGERRLMRWESPWGWGAPGWHLECSVMSIDLLGSHFDIHTGGVDHRELHHVNEIAQSEAYLDDGADWVPYWLHNEFINVKSAKMAKSKGTGLRLVELVEDGVDPAAYRLWLLTSHYRAQSDFSRAAIDAAGTTLRRLRARVDGPLPIDRTQTYQAAMAAAGDEARAVVRRIDEAVSDDLNTARVLAVLQEALQNDDLPVDDRRLVAAVAENLLGLGLDEPAVEAAALPADLEATVLDMLAQRVKAREARDWGLADQIRSNLERMGIGIKDTPQGTTWEPIK
ncbi:cysteine--tRNA ligase [Mangrovihabitans endophyticus]|uniref:Cysteine--tRNA ligase n=1 Tax=Mangrovihabitans endophyticus TaxID=1751298 RepID=A0A8J3C3Q1_9ACTN|nr:cysteine--tRNA ligase [Mangrovihabitans endophyticus]GGL05957.1 cysteine--tRNA ligase [Mangrovihabitans endophyticus]